MDDYMKFCHIKTSCHAQEVFTFLLKKSQSASVRTVGI